jgi:hypothetical protein
MMVTSAIDVGRDYTPRNACGMNSENGIPCQRGIALPKRHNASVGREQEIGNGE